jgi:hypothetical protein
MSAQGAAAGDELGGNLRGGNISRGSAATIAQPWDALPSVLAQRLCAAGILTCEKWRALGAKRRMIWGITRSMVEQIDAATAALTRGQP